MPAPVSPHSEKIVQAVLAALQKINHADGYFTQPGAVERYSKERMKHADSERPWITVAIQRESRAIRAGSSDHWESHLNIAIEAVIDKNVEAPQVGPFTDELISQISADIARVLGGVDWNSLSAMLVDVDMSSFRANESEDPEDGALFEITVRYSHTMTDPSIALAF